MLAKMCRPEGSHTDLFFLRRVSDVQQETSLRRASALASPRLRDRRTARRRRVQSPHLGDRRPLPVSSVRTGQASVPSLCRVKNAGIGARVCVSPSLSSPETPFVWSPSAFSLSTSSRVAPPSAQCASAPLCLLHVSSTDREAARRGSCVCDSGASHRRRGNARQKGRDTLVAHTGAAETVRVEERRSAYIGDTDRSKMISTASVSPGVFKHCLLAPTKKMLFLLSLVSLFFISGPDSLLPPATALKRPASHAILSPLISRGGTQPTHARLMLTDLLHSSPRQALRTLQGFFLRPSVSSRLAVPEGTSSGSLKQAKEKVSERDAEEEIGEEGEKETAEHRKERALSPFFSPLVVGVVCDAHPEKAATVSELLGKPRQGGEKEGSADAEETARGTGRLGRERGESVFASLEHLPASSPAVLFRLNYADTAFASGRASRTRGEEERVFPREEESERDVVLSALVRDRTAAEAGTWARLLGRVGTVAVLPLFSGELRCDPVFATRKGRTTLEDFSSCGTTAEKDGESLCGEGDTQELYVQLPEEVSVMLKGLRRGLEERRGRREEATGEPFRLVVLLMDAPDERWTQLVTRAVTRAVEEAVAVRETKEEAKNRETQTEGETAHAAAPSAPSPLLSTVVLSLPPASRSSAPASVRFSSVKKGFLSLLEETRQRHEQAVKARQERLATLMEREAKRIEEEKGKAEDRGRDKEAKGTAAHGADGVSANDGDRQENESGDDPRRQRAKERTSFRDQIYDTLPDAIVKRLFPFSSAADEEEEGRDAPRPLVPQELQFSSLVSPDVLCWAVQQKLLTQATPILQKWRKRVELEGKLIPHFGQESSEMLQTLLPLFDAATLAAVQTPARQLARRELQTLLQDELRHLYLQQLMLLERRSRTKLRASLLTALKAFPSPREAVRALWRREGEETEEAEAARRRMRQAAEALLSDLAREAAPLLPPRLSKVENASEEVSFCHSPAARGAWQLPAVGNLAETAKRTIRSVSQRVVSSLQERKTSLTQQLAGVPWVRARLQRSLATRSRVSVPSQTSSPSSPSSSSSYSSSSVSSSASLASSPSSSDGESGGRNEEKDADASNIQGRLESGDNSYEERVANEVGRRLREAASAAFEAELAQLHATLMGKLRASLRQLTEEFVASPLAEKIRIQSRLLGGISLRELLRFSVRPSLSLTAMLRRRGEGNFQGFLAWNTGPLNMIFGFANDAPVVQPDGKVAPAFRMQPKVHFDVTRTSR
ncbi:UNVERIFIED_CONTAM: hypothetical protein HHA_213010 [Hammondia hammondi]|eukprot:XP_008883983.1 hypothetical protein HHA_213010 [Hammondia hammondi]